MPAPVSSAYGIELGSNTCVFVCLFGFAFRDCGYNLSCRLRKEDLWYNDLWNEPRSGELRTQKLKSHLVRTQSLNVLPLKPEVGQYIAIHATLTARDFLLISTLPVHSPAFFPKPLPTFPCVGCG